MDGNDTPGTKIYLVSIMLVWVIVYCENDLPLNEELDEESGGTKGALSLGQDPGGNETSSEDSRTDNGSSTTNKLTEISNDGSADASTDLHEDGGTRGTGVLHLLLGEHESGVRILTL